MKEKIWYLYVVECADGTLYTGITTSISRRIDEHNYGTRGAKYTRSRRPVRLKLTKEYMGWYSRMNCESMSFFTKGKGLDMSVWQGRGTAPPQAFMAQRRAHSEKPLASYLNIEKRSKGPYCYFFSRHQRPGWLMFGDEVGKLGAIK